MLRPRPGLCQAVQYILRAKPNAMVVGGPPCSSFVWINSATSKRCADNPFGDTDREYIRSSNKLLIWFWLSHMNIYSQQPVNVASYLKIGFINIFSHSARILRLTSRWMLMLLLCAARSLFTLTEQPSSSTMHHFPYMKFVVLAMKKMGIFWAKTCLFPGCIQLAHSKFLCC